MTDFISVALALVAYRLVSLLVGLSFALLGYKLFKLGIYEKAGELKAAWGDRNLALKQAAPGTFFALFGAIVVGIALLRGVDFERLKNAAGNAARQSEGQVAGPTLLLPPIVPDDIKATIERAMNGKPLTPTDRSKLEDWLKLQEPNYERFKAWEPVPPKPRA